MNSYVYPTMDSPVVHARALQDPPTFETHLQLIHEDNMMTTFVVRNIEELPWQFHTYVEHMAFAFNIAQPLSFRINKVIHRETHLEFVLLALAQPFVIRAHNVFQWRPDGY